jgi:hypothetical protein
LHREMEDRAHLLVMAMDLEDRDRQEDLGGIQEDFLQEEDHPVEGHPVEGFPQEGDHPVEGHPVEGFPQEGDHPVEGHPVEVRLVADRPTNLQVAEDGHQHRPVGVGSRITQEEEVGGAHLHHRLPAEEEFNFKVLLGTPSRRRDRPPGRVVWDG